MKSILTALFIIFFAFVSTCFSGALQPKTGNSDTMPETIVLSNGYYQCRYNIKGVSKIDENGKIRKSFDYAYIELKSMDKATIHAALVENKFDGNEIEIINMILKNYR